MAYRWSATYHFDYPLLDQPVDIEGITIYPTPPDNDSVPSCVHYYEFETENIDKIAQKLSSDIAKSRLEELIELSVLAPYHTQVKFHALILINSTFGGVNSSLISLQLERLIVIQAKIYNCFTHYQIENGIYDPF